MTWEEREAIDAAAEKVNQTPIEFAREVLARAAK